MSAFDYSYICADVYELPLYKFESYPDCVSGLYNEMEKFFVVFVRCVQLCKQVLEDEQKIKSDNKYCKYLFDQFKENVLKEVADIIMMIPIDSEYLSEDRNTAIASRNRYDTDEAWAPIGFHNFSKLEVKQLVIKQILEEETGCDLTRTEILLFGDDEEKVHKYRYIIKNFDKLIPASYNRKNLPAKTIMMFFMFIGIKDKLFSTAVEYFNKLYQQSQNKYTVVSYQAVNGYKKEILIDKDGSYKSFVEDLKREFLSPSELQKASNF